MSRDAAGLAAQTEVLGASLTEEQAREIYRQGEESVVFALLTLARKLAGVRQKAASLAGGGHSSAATRRVVRRDLRVASRAAGRAVGRADRDCLGGRPGAAAAQASSPSSARPVYVFRPAGGSLRQQSGRARHPACGDHPQKQLRQPEPARRRRSGGAHEYLSHSQTTRP